MNSFIRININAWIFSIFKYHYCGPGTKLLNRLAQGDNGVNKLDEACKMHDMVYSQFQSGKERQSADAILATKARMRSYSRNATVGEKTSGTAVAYGMLFKWMLGLRSVGIQQSLSNKLITEEKKSFSA